MENLNRNANNLAVSIGGKKPKIRTKSKDPQ